MLTTIQERPDKAVTVRADSVDDTVLIAPQPRRGRRLGWLLALVPASLTFAVTASGAADRQLWADEYATWHAASLDFESYRRLIDNVDFIIAPYYLLMHAWISIFGDSQASLRAPSIVAMTVTSGLLVLLGRKLFNTSTGLIAGTLLALVPSISRYAQEARPYALAIMFATLATLILVNAIESPTWPRWTLYGIAMLLTGAAHIVAVTILAAHLFMIWHSARRKDTLGPWRWLAPAIITVSVMGPYAMAASEQDGVIMWIKADQAAVLSLPERLAGSSVIATILALLAAVGCHQLLISKNRSPLVLLGMWAIFPPIFTLITFELLHLFLHRYLLFTVPAWVLLAAFGLDSLGRAIGNRGKTIAVAVLATLILPALFWLSLPDQAIARHNPMDGQPDFQGAAMVILKNMRTGDGIIYGGSHDRGRRAMEYELRSSQPRDVLLAKSGRELGGFVAQECSIPSQCIGDVDRIWIVNSAQGKDGFAALAPLTVALLRERYAVTETKDFMGVRLVLLTRKEIAAPAA